MAHLNITDGKCQNHGLASNEWIKKNLFRGNQTNLEQAKLNLSHTAQMENIFF